MCVLCSFSLFFLFFNDTATTEIYTLSLHDALPIAAASSPATSCCRSCGAAASRTATARSGEHTSGLPSQFHLVCRLLLEKKKKKKRKQKKKKKKRKKKKKQKQKQTK